MTDHRQDNFAFMVRGLTAASSALQTLADNMPLAVSFLVQQRSQIFASGELLSQRALVQCGIRNADPGSTEARLGTDDYVFTYASTFRYRPGGGWSDPAKGIGLMYEPTIETAYAADSMTATPFDSGGVFQHLRPADLETEQIGFVRDHELPVPEYRQLFALYLEHYYREAAAYLSDEGPNDQYPIPVAGGDARRWTFETRFQNCLSIEENIAVVFLPIGIALDDATQDQLDAWEDADVDIRFYSVKRPPEAFDSLEQAGRQYLHEQLGL